MKMWGCSLVGVGVIGLLCGGLCMSSQRKSLFGLLLGMEVLTLSVYIIILGNYSFLGGISNFGLVFLGFGVCEAALGLSVLVFIVRMSGSDYVLSLSLGHF
uniref:NADH-ubiquinone oxidoreductase chain 4L n=1 Tax=Anodontites trapesialis TaxID=1961152 RepID=A0A1Y9T604_9BIVA|nr:NADH dehydrogenase subunit 4L [Anodontites trapesialis]